MERIEGMPGDGHIAKVVSARPLMSTINLKEQTSLRFWCRQFGVTPLELCCAVERVGNDPAAVRTHLARRRSAVIRLRPRRVRRSPLSRAATRLHNAAVAILGMRSRGSNFLPHGFVP